MENKSIIFMGTPDFAVESLKALYNQGIEIKAVVTQPDKQRGRGRKVSYTPVKQEAIKLNLPVLQPEKMRNPEFIEQLKKYNADLFVVVAFRILPKAVLEIPKINSINLHASLLPEYRGAAPINHALFNGDEFSGLTVFFLNNKKVDSGKIVQQVKVKIEDEDNFETLYNKLKIAGAEALPGIVKKIFTNEITTTEQDITSAKNLQAPKIFTEDCQINWNLDAEKIHNKIRGLAPKPGAFSFLQGKRFKFITTTFEKSTDLKKSIGEVIEVDRKKNSISVSCGKGILNIHKLQPEGKGAMEAAAYINGYGIEEGVIFGE